MQSSSDSASGLVETIITQLQPPSTVRAVMPVRGRYAVAYDARRSAIVLIDLADGTVLDDLTIDGCTGLADSWPAAGSDRTVVARGTIGFHVVEVVDDRLKLWGEVRAPQPMQRLQWSGILPDGAVVAVWQHPHVLTTHMLDGTSGQLPLPPRSFQVSVAPDGDIVIGTSGSRWGPDDATSFAVDLGSRQWPRLLWTHHGPTVFATFVRGGDAVALTSRFGSSWLETAYAPVILDRWTGETLGEPRDTAIAFVYFAPLTAFGGGANSRLLYWQWTWREWASAMFDVSTNEPSVMVVTEDHDAVEFGLPRDDGTSAYEFRLRGKSIVKVDVDGVFTPYGSTGLEGLSRLRHGFLLGHDGPAIGVLRDLEANRAPSADAGRDRAVECSGPEGTPVVFDGSGSTDPDSTPGTQDDLDSFAWTIDGARVSEQRSFEAVLDLGAHEARLVARDVVGAAGSDSAALTVRDSRPPEISLDLLPVLEDGRLWAHRWLPRASASDVCDGPLDPERRLRVPDADLGAAAEWRRATSMSIEVLETTRGVAVTLFGPDRETIERVWRRARDRGGLDLAEGAIALRLQEAAPGGPDRDRRATYLLDPVGRLTDAVAFGADADLWIRALTRDRAGLEAVADVSLRSTIDALCEQSSPDILCRSPGSER